MPNSPICPAQWMYVLRRRWRRRRRRFILRRRWRRLLVSPGIHNGGRRGARCGHHVLLVCAGLAFLHCSLRRAFRRDRAVLVWKCDRGGVPTWWPDQAHATEAYHRLQTGAHHRSTNQSVHHSPRESTRRRRPNRTGEASLSSTMAIESQGSGTMSQAWKKKQMPAVVTT